MQYKYLKTTSGDLPMVPFRVTNQSAKVERTTIEGRFIIGYSGRDFSYTTINGQKFWYIASSGEFHAQDGVSEIAHQSTLWFTVPEQFRNNEAFFTLIEGDGNFTISCLLPCLGYMSTSQIHIRSLVLKNGSTYDGYTKDYIESLNEPARRVDWWMDLSESSFTHYMYNVFGNEAGESWNPIYGMVRWTGDGQFHGQIIGGFSPWTSWEDSIGTTTTNVKTIIVKWNRPHDNKELRGMFKINVQESDNISTHETDEETFGGGGGSY